MQTPKQLAGQRDRFTALLREARGEVNSAAVAWLSKESHVHYTTLARYLLHRQTKELRAQSRDAVAMVFGVNPAWLRDGQGSRQLSVWPILTPSRAECEIPDPDAQIDAVIRQLRLLDESIRIRAYRAAISAAIESVAAAGMSLGDEAYRCLMRLDAIRQRTSERAAS
jgi:hypothetical protein